MKDINNASFAYSIHMLRMLLKMKLITQDEYNRIAAIRAAHYDAEIYYV